jgi:hypothetical protein
VRDNTPNFDEIVESGGGRVIVGRPYNSSQNADYPQAAETLRLRNIEQS